MTGTIQGARLTAVLRKLIVGRSSGLLFVKNGGLEKGLYFASGAVVNAESNVAEEGIGYRLLDLGVLTPQALENAMRQVEPGRTLDQVLVASGLLSETDAAKTLRSLAEQIVVSVFDWTEGTYFFQEGDFSFKGGFEINTAALVLEGVRRMYDFEETKQALLADPRPLRPLVSGRGVLSLEPTEGFIFSRVDGTLSASEICALSIISEEMTCRVLHGLLTAAIIGHADSRTSRTGTDATAATAPSDSAASAPAAASSQPPPAARSGTRNTAPEATATAAPAGAEGSAPASSHESPPSRFSPGASARPSSPAAAPASSPTSRSEPGPRPAPGGKPRVERYQPEAEPPASPGNRATPRVERWTPPGSEASSTGGASAATGGTTGSFRPPVGTTTGAFSRPSGASPPGAIPGVDATGPRPRPPNTMGRLLPWQEERLGELEGLYESLDGLNLYAVLGLGRDAPTHSVEEAYQRLSEKFHPGNNPWITDDSVRQRLVFVFAKIKAAHRTLAADKGRIEYDEQLRKHDREHNPEVNIRMEFSKTDRQKAIEERVKESEQLFREASKLYEMHRYHDARTKLLKAIDVHPEEAKYFALAGRIEVLNPNVRWQKDAENHLRRAVELDRWNPDYRVLLGQLYKNAGLKHKAKREFIAALEIDPRNEIALPEVPVAERPVVKAPESGVPPPAAPQEEDDEVDWS